MLFNQSVSVDPISLKGLGMDFREPYDISPHLGEGFYSRLQSKWTDRKDAIQELISITEKNPVLAPTDELRNLISDLSKILVKDSNINVASSSAQLLAKLASGAPTVFKSVAPSIIQACLTRMKDTKPIIKNACSECLDAAYSSTVFSDVLEPIRDGLKMTAPGSKIQACDFFTRIMLKIDFPTAKASAPATKEIVNQLCQLTLGSDSACREASMKSLAAFMRAVTKPTATPLMSTVSDDKLKIAKIEEYYEQFIVEFPFDNGMKKTELVSGVLPASKPEVSDVRLFVAPYDLIKHTDNTFYEKLRSSKWSDRKDAIQELLDIAEKNPIFVPNEDELQNLIKELSKILANDSNINVAACAALVLSKLAYGAKEVFESFAPSVIHRCLTRMKDTKSVIKNACSECLDQSYAATRYMYVVDSIKEGLKMTAPASKIQTCEFFMRIMLKIDFENVKQAISPTKEVVDHLCQLAVGSDSACRDAAMKSLGAFMRAVGKPIAAPLLSNVRSDKLKAAKIEEYYEKFTAEYPNNNTSKAQSENVDPVNIPVNTNNITIRKRLPHKKPVSSKPKDEHSKKSAPLMRSVSSKPKELPSKALPSMASKKPAASKPVVVALPKNQNTTKKEDLKRDYDVVQRETMQDDEKAIPRGTTPRRSLLRLPMAVVRPMTHSFEKH